MKKLLLVSALAGLGVVGWKVHSHRAAPPASGDAIAQDGRGVVVDRFWIDHLPRSPKEAINALALLSDQEAGVFQNTTMFRGSYEIFMFEREGNKITATYPQTDEVDHLTARARRCTDDGMDFCLDIDGGSRGVRHYYSKKDWVIKSLADERALADRVEAGAGK